jgi:hypothetical protein
VGVWCVSKRATLSPIRTHRFSLSFALQASLRAELWGVWVLSASAFLLKQANILWSTGATVHSLIL